MDPETVQFFAVKLDSTAPAAAARLAAVLPPDRWDRPSAGAAGVIGRALAAWAVYTVAGIPPAAQRVCRTPQGKPFLPGNPVYFNLSHSGCWVVCAVSDRPVGLDVERRREYRPRVAARLFSPDARQTVLAAADRDRAFTEQWSRLEAQVKQCGCGLGGARRATLCERVEQWWDGEYVFSVCT